MKYNEYKFVKGKEEVIELGKEGWTFVAYIQEVGLQGSIRTANYIEGLYLMVK